MYSVRSPSEPRRQTPRDRLRGGQDHGHARPKRGKSSVNGVCWGGQHPIYRIDNTNSGSKPSPRRRKEGERREERGVGVVCGTGKGGSSLDGVRLGSAYLETN